MNKIYGALLVVAALSCLGYWRYQHSAVPRVSIITSVYNGDEYIEEFLADVTSQTIFKECELILINAASPGHEEPVIKRYMQQFPNIVYKKLEKDPGIYGVWNECIRMARAPYITNCNLDDHFSPYMLEVHAAELDRDADIDLVYADRFETDKKHQTFSGDLSGHKYIASREFNKKNMLFCVPGNSPMWRKSLHEKYGYFDESFKISGDWQMWLRATEGGAQFKRIPGPYGIYYRNPNGLSSGRNMELTTREWMSIYNQYKTTFAWNG